MDKMENRISLAIPKELDDQIIELKKTDKFVKSSYSEIVRYLLGLGIKSAGKKAK